MATKKKSTRASSARSTSKRATPAKKAEAVEPVDDEVIDEVTVDEVEALVAPAGETTVAVESPAEATKPPAPVQGVTRAVAEDTEDDATALVNGELVEKFVKKDLIDRVIARSGVKPRFARQVTEALLIELGAMLEEREMLQLQPLGNLKVQRRKDVGDGEVIITKLKRKKDGPEGDDPLAAAAE